MSLRKCVGVVRSSKTGAGPVLRPRAWDKDGVIACPESSHRRRRLFVSTMSTPEPFARANKRQRTEDPPDLSAAKRHDKHWCRDGSVVLHVDDTLFRVHQSVCEGGLR